MSSRNLSFGLPLALTVFLFLGMTLVASPLVHAQKNESRPSRPGPSKTDASQVWKAEMIATLAKQISRAQTESEKLELVAQQTWLDSWQPGKMRSVPANASHSITTAKRTEPKIPSENRNAVKQVLQEKGITDRERFERLEAIAARFPDDIGINQAVLHWIDNDSTRRKLFLNEVERYSSKLASLLNQRLADPQAIADVGNTRSLTPEQLVWQQVYQFTLYRRVRGLAYRELPDVMAQTPILDQAAFDKTIETSFKELIKSAGSGRPEFILIEVRMHRRAKRFGMALSLLEKYGTAISPKWYLKKRRDLLQELQWHFPYREAALTFADKYPEDNPR